MKYLVGIVIGLMLACVGLVVSYIAAVDQWGAETPADKERRELREGKKFWKAWDKLVEKRGYPA